MLPLRRTIAILSLIIFSCAPLARAETYFAFAPDPWQSYRLAVSTVTTPYQFFQSATDFTLTGFSFWVDNTGSSGNVTFTLLDEENTTLAAKTITLNQTPAVPGGTKLDIELDTPVEISHYRPYSIQISSTLLGFGLYYANRINILEHNLQYTTEYAFGVAKLGSEQQSYTFKFALENPLEDTNTEQPPAEETPPEVTPTSTTPIATVISNARITTITDTTALAAWTTNLAADSRVSVRTQLNPLYIYTTAYDNTIELEHALPLTGLTPSSAYFVDFFSQQNEDEPILTTYTVSFTTAPAEPGTTVPITPTPSSTTATSSQSTSTTPSGATATSTLPAVTFGAGNGTDSFSINWEIPAGGAPSDGYRIDILDESHHLIRQLTAPSDATSRNIALLLPGDHEIIVYANNDGVYEKVADSTSFEAKKTRSPLFWFWYLAGVVISLLIATAFLFHRKEKTELPKLE